MEYTTKYDIGDKLWVMYDNKACECEILGINFSASCSVIYGNPDIFLSKYVIKIGDNVLDKVFYTDNELFVSKNELIESL